jgi:hypothetical protein
VENERDLQTTLTSDSLRKRNSRYITVLPIAGAGIDRDLLAVVGDEFRKALSATGAFEVMERELMEEILQEQEFQLSDQCDQTTCVVEAGRMIGVSKIVAVTATKTGTSIYAVSARLVDVATAKDVVQGSEEREGESYVTLKRLVVNLASILAGAPNQDHMAWLGTQSRILVLKKRLEKRLHSRLSLHLGFEGSYPLYLFSPDPAESDREIFLAYQRQKENLEEPTFRAQKGTLGFGAAGAFGLRIAKPVSVQLSMGYASNGWRESGSSTYYNLDQLDISQADTARTTGPARENQDCWENASFFTVGPVAVIHLLQKPLLGLSWTLSPQYCYAVYRWRSKTHVQIDENWYADSHTGPDDIQGKQRIDGTILRDTRIVGHGVGVETGLGLAYFIAPRIGIEVSARLKSVFAYNMSGTAHQRTQKTVRAYNDLPSPVPDAQKDETTYEDTTYSVEYLTVKDPLTGRNQNWLMPRGTDIPYENRPAVGEWSSIGLRISMIFYF